MPVLTAAAWHVPWHNDCSFPRISSMPRKAGPCSVAMDTPSPSCHWPWWAGTMIHRDQREEHQDDLNPAEKGRATSLEQCQSQPWGPFSMKLIVFWQNGRGKTLKNLFDVPGPQSCWGIKESPAPHLSSSLLTKVGLLTCITSCIPANANFHAQLTGKCLQWQLWERFTCFFCLAIESDITPDCTRGGSCSVMCQAVPPSTKQKEQAGFSCTVSPTFPTEKNLSLCQGILESTQGIS